MGNSRERGACELLNIKRKKKDSGLSIEGCYSRIPRLVNPENILTLSWPGKYQVYILSPWYVAAESESHVRKNDFKSKSG